MKWIRGIGVSAVSIAALAIAFFEGHTKDFADYADITGVPTACYGHTGPDVKIGKVRNQAECLAMLETDIEIYQKGVEGCITKPMQPYQEAAFISHAYNFGITAFCTSQIASNFNAGRPTEACNHFLDWVFVTVNHKKVFVQGLLNRRMKERDICLGREQ